MAKKFVEIHRIDQDLVVEGLPRSMQNRIAVRSLKLVAGRGRQRGLHPLVERCSTLANDCPQLGLADILSYVALREGYEVHVSGIRRPLPDQFAADNLPVGVQNIELLEFIEQAAGGVIRYGNGAQLERLAADIVVAFPNSLMAFLSDRWAQARRFYDGLKGITSESVKLVDPQAPKDENDHRIIVSTFAGLCHAYPEHEKRHLVFALDAEEAVGERARFTLSRCLQAKLFAFQRIGRRVPPRSNDLMVRIFGLREVTIPRNGCRLRPVITHRHPVDATMPLVRRRRSARNNGVITPKDDASENDLRTRLIATVARKIVEQANHYQIELPSTAGVRPPLQTVLVAADLNHAARFAERLRRWDLHFVGPRAMEHPLIAKLMRRPNPRWNPLSTCSITTPFGLADIDLEWIDVIIWAVGDKHGLDLSPYQLAQRLADRRPLHVFDFQDRYAPGARKRSQWRMANYASRGWLAPGTDPYLARIEKYLDGCSPGRKGSHAR